MKGSIYTEIDSPGLLSLATQLSMVPDFDYWSNISRSDSYNTIAENEALRQAGVVWKYSTLTEFSTSTRYKISA